MAAPAEALALALAREDCQDLVKCGVPRAERPDMSRPFKALFCALLAATSSVAVATSAQAEGAEYEVKSGEYLRGIAAKLGVTLPDLLTANGLTITSVIHAGDRLVVPPGGKLPAPATRAAAAPAPAPAPPVTTPYVVVSGDYFFSIAAKHGVTVGALLSANRLRITSTIRPGQTLAIPPRSIPLPEPAAAVVPAPAAAPAEAPAPAPAPAAAPAQPAPAPAAPPPVAPAAPSATPIDTVVAYLHAQIGKPYKFNTAGPDSFDCSGLVLAAYLQVGVKLPHYSVLQSTYGVAVDWTTEAIRPGDLIFTISSSSPGEIGHVGVAVDSRRWIHAVGTGQPVRISSMPKATSIRVVRRIL